jgi:hypothetical protein
MIGNCLKREISPAAVSPVIFTHYQTYIYQAGAFEKTIELQL